MKLDAVDGVVPVLDAHDLPVLRVGDGGQALRQGGSVHGQGMVASHGRHGRAALEERAVKVHRRLGGFAVHQDLGIGDCRAIGCTDGLVAQADPQDGDLGAKLEHRLDEDARVLRAAGAGGENDAVRVQGLQFLHGHLVVADDFHRGVQLAHELVKVIGKAVVAVDENGH